MRLGNDTRENGGQDRVMPHNCDDCVNRHDCDSAPPGRQFPQFASVPANSERYAGTQLSEMWKRYQRSMFIGSPVAHSIQIS
jgi:hypothetical protein